MSWTYKDFKDQPIKERLAASPAIHVCKYCGAGSLKWGLSKNKKWQYQDVDGNPHNCPANKEYQGESYLGFLRRTGAIPDKRKK